MLTEEIKKLSNPEKWLLFNDLWDKLSQNPDNVKTSEEQKRILNERYQEFLENPKEGLSWEEVKAKVLKSLGNTTLKFVPRLLKIYLKLPYFMKKKTQG